MGNGGMDPESFDTFIQQLRRYFLNCTKRYITNAPAAKSGLNAILPPRIYFRGVRTPKSPRSYDGSLG